MTVLKLLVGSLLLLAQLAGCGGDALPESTPAATFPPPNSTPIPTDVAPPATLPATPMPTPTSQPTESAATPQPADTFPVPPERDFFQLARELMPGVGEVDRVVNRHSSNLEVGHRETFKLVDLWAPELYQNDFELRLVTPHAYWFVEDGLEVSQEDIEQSAAEFEDTIYPQVTDAFGSEWTPGVDGDPHLYILNAALEGVGGYYSPADEYPKEIRPVSNEIEAIYINTQYILIGTAIYSQVLAHELQHAVHWNADPTEESWVNEGLSELAVTVAGQMGTLFQAFLHAGPTSLIVWPAGDVGLAENYGAAYLFMHYLTEHYGGQADLRPLLAQPGDGIEGLNAFLEAGGYEARFEDIFRDWAIANLLDEDGGRYGYADMNITFPVYRNLKSGSELVSSIPQFATEYVRLEQLPGPALLSFEGDAAAPLLPVEVGEGCWWSNNGDVIDSTLTARIDLRQAESAALTYQVWFSIEEDWDYAYVEVSDDGGESWQILETPLTSSEDPLDVAFGPGYTGSSSGWRDESAPLGQWAGQEIMARFQYITDAARNDHGLCLRHLSVSGPAGGEYATPLEWTPNGFAWTNNLVRQSFIVQVIYQGQEGSANRVLQMEPDGMNRATMTLEAGPDSRRVVVAVQPLAPSTRLPASYTLKLKPAE